jgi:hypothetical protein
MVIIYRLSRINPIGMRHPGQKDGAAFFAKIRMLMASGINMDAKHPLNHTTHILQIRPLKLSIFFDNDYLITA